MMRWIRNLLLLAPVVMIALAFSAPRKGLALPLFARKYGAPCTLCHLAYPRLNQFGMDFRQRGFRMEGEKGQSPWEAKEFPISLIGNTGVQYLRVEAADSSGKRTAFSTTRFVQNEVEFHTAGTLGPRLSFHFDNGFAEGVGSTLTSGQAFLQFDDVAKNGLLNLKAGIFDAELPYLSGPRATTLNDYITPVTLDGEGGEFNGTGSGWTYAAGLINSGRAFGKPNSTNLNNLEDAYIWVMRNIRNQLVSGRVFMDRQDPRVSGKNSSQHLVVQGSAYLNHGRWALIPGYSLESFGDEPDTTGSGTGTLQVHSGLLEALVFLDPSSRWLFTGRYEIRHVGLSRVSARKGDDTQTVLNLSFYINPNAKIALDWTHGMFRMHNAVEDNPSEPTTDEVQLYGMVGY